MLIWHSRSAIAGYVLETGRLVAEGTAEALWNNDELRAAYLGGRKMVKCGMISQGVNAIG